VWILYGLVGWLTVLPAIAAAIVCLLHLERSRWVAILLGGFAADAILSILHRGTFLLMGPAMTATGVGLVSAALSLLQLVARGVVVFGLAGLLRELPARTP
jgi:hypothetical protein